MSSIILNIVLLVSFLMFFALTAVSFSSVDVIAAYPLAPVVVIGSLFTALFLLVNSDQN